MPTCNLLKYTGCFFVLDNQNMVIMAEDNDKDETSVDPIDGCDHLDGIFKPKVCQLDQPM